MESMARVGTKDFRQTLYSRFPKEDTTTKTTTTMDVPIHSFTTQKDFSRKDRKNFYGIESTYEDTLTEHTVRSHLSRQETGENQTGRSP